MSTEFALAISIISFCLATGQAILNIRRNCKKETQEDTSQITTVIVKLENISTNVTEIKNDLRGLKSDVKDHSVRLVKLEQRMYLMEKKDEQENIFTVE